MPKNDDIVSVGARSRRTRRQIAAAARACFAAHGVSATSVQQIVQAAGLSRATFYLHYSTKDAILVDLVRDMLPGLGRLFRKLRVVDPVDHAGVRRWISSYVQLVRKHPDDVRVASLSSMGDTEARKLIIANRMSLIAMLGRRYAFFRYAHDDKREEQRRLIRCLLLMIQLEQMVTGIARRDVIADEDIAIDELADRLLQALLETGHDS